MPSGGTLTLSTVVRTGVGGRRAVLTYICLSPLEYECCPHGRCEEKKGVLIRPHPLFVEDGIRVNLCFSMSRGLVSVRWFNDDDDAGGDG